MSADGGLAQLARLRRRLRAWLCVDGAARAAMLALGGFLALALTDWWLVLPWPLRAAGAIWTLTLSVLALDRGLVRPLLAAIPLRELAGRLATLRGDEGDELAGLVDRAERRADGAAELWARAAAASDARLVARPLAGGVSGRRPLRRVAAAAALGAALAIVWGAAPGWVATAWNRLVWPPGRTEWPRRVAIVPVSGSAKVARGEPFTARMRLARGDKPEQRAFVVVRQAGQRPLRYMMRRAEDGTFQRTLDNVVEDFDYGFEAGDDQTDPAVGRVRAIDRPVIERLTADVTPPGYLHASPTLGRPLDERRLEAIASSRVVVHVLASKPLAAGGAAGGGSRLRIGESAAVGLSVSTSEPREAQGGFEVERSGPIEVVAVDSDGFESATGPPIELSVQVDRPPSVRIVRPTASVAATPTGAVSLEFVAEDDFHLKDLGLWLSRGKERLATMPVRPEKGELGARAALPVTVGLERQPVMPGDVIELRVVASDDAEEGGVPRKPSQSAPLRIEIVAEAELAERLRQAHGDLSRQLEALVTAQEAVADRTGAAMAMLQSGSDDEAGDQVRTAQQRQRGLVTRARQLRGELESLSEQARRNGLEWDPTSSGAAKMAGELGDILATAMSEALVALTRAVEADAETARLTALDESAGRQREAIERLRRLVSAAGATADVRAVARRTRELLDRQEALTRRSAASAQAIGQTAGALSREQRGALTEMSGEQARLREEAERIVSRLAELSAPGGATTRAAEAADDASAAQRAYGVAEGIGLVARMREAAERLRDNRTQAATQSQRDAESTLRSMLAAMEEGPARQLEALSKQLADLERRLARLVAAQERLIGENPAQAGAAQSTPPDRWQRWAERQSSLATTTRGLLRSETSGEGAVQSLRRPLAAAAEHMHAAAAKLSEADGPAALLDQQAAREGLQRATVALREAAERTEQELARQTMAALKEQLTRLRDEQAKIVDRTKALPEGRGRAVRVRATGLAAQEEALLGPLAEVGKQLKEAIVYGYVLRQIETDMRSAAAGLKKVDRGAALAAEVRALAALVTLIESLPAEDELGRGGKFAEGSSQGAGEAGQSGSGGGVPALAELRALRQLQAALQAETAAAGAPGEGSKRDGAGADLGARQRGLREVAEKMMQRVKENGS